MGKIILILSLLRQIHSIIFVNNNNIIMKNNQIIIFIGNGLLLVIKFIIIFKWIHIINGL